MRWNTFLFGFIACALLMMSCGSFAYKWYVMDLVRYEGWLRGPKPANDIDIIRCAPTDDDKAPCVVMFMPEFENLRTDGETCLRKLEACQRQCK